MIASIRCAPVIRQSEAKSRAAIDNTFRPDFSSMALDNALHGCQPDARAAKFALVVQTLERREQTGCPRHIETRTVVAHEISAGAVGLWKRSNGARTYFVRDDEIGRAHV